MPNLPPNSSFQRYELRSQPPNFLLGVGAGMVFSAVSAALLLYFAWQKRRFNGSTSSSRSQSAVQSDTELLTPAWAEVAVSPAVATPRPVVPQLAFLFAPFTRRVLPWLERIPLMGVMILVVTLAFASQFVFDLGEAGRLWGELLFLALLPAAWLMAHLEQRLPELKAAEQAEADLAPKTLFNDGSPTASARLGTPGEFILSKAEGRALSVTADGSPTASARLEMPVWMRTLSILRTFANPVALWESLTEQPLRMLLLALAFAATTASAMLAPDSKNNLIAALLWTTGVVLFLIACLPTRPGQHPSTSARKPRAFAQGAWPRFSLAGLKDRLRRQPLLNWLAAAMLLAGTIAVLYGLERSPIGVEQDEGQIGSLAFRVEPEQRPVFGTSSYYDLTVIFPYLQRASMNLFGDTMGGMRVLPGMMGSLSLLVVYLLARRMFGPGPALVIGTVFAFAPYHLLFSRMGVHDMLVMQLFIPATLYFIYRGLHTGHYFDFAAAGVVMGIGLWQDYNNKIMILSPIVGSTFLYLFVRHPAYWRTEFPKIGVWGLGVAVVLLPVWATLARSEKLFVPPARDKFIFSEPHLSSAIEKYGTSNPALIIAYQTERAFFGLNYFGDNTLWATNQPYLDSLLSIFFFIGLAYSLWRWKEPRYVILLIWLGAGMQMSIWSNDPPMAHRMTPLILVSYLLAGVGLVTILRLGRLAMRWPVRFTAVCGLALLSVTTYLGVTNYLAMDDYHQRLEWIEMSQTGKLIREFFPTHSIYYVGGPRAYANSHGGIIFDSQLLSWQVPTLDEVSSVLPLPQPAERDVLFIFGMGHLNQVLTLQKYYPQGILKEWRRGEELYLRTYTVSREEINSFRIAYRVSRNLRVLQKFHRREIRVRGENTGKLCALCVLGG